MAEDRKFKFENGQFINRVSGLAIPDDEPVIIFRARDKHTLSVLRHYQTLANDPHHRRAIQDRINEFSAYQEANPHLLKEPGITALSAGVEPNYSLPALPEVSRLKRELARLKALGDGLAESLKVALEVLDHEGVCEADCLAHATANAALAAWETK